MKFQTFKDKIISAKEYNILYSNYTSVHYSAEMVWDEKPGNEHMPADNKHVRIPFQITSLV